MTIPKKGAHLSYIAKYSLYVVKFKEFQSPKAAHLHFSIVSPEKSKVYDRIGYTCASCGCEFPVTVKVYSFLGRSDKHWRLFNYDRTRFLTVDHIIPKKEGGGNSYSNLQPLCNICNVHKGSRLN